LEIRSEKIDLTITPGIQEMIDRVRQRRGFIASEWLKAKAIILNDYLRNSNLKSVVVAVSGGIDSAVVLGIAKLASQASDSPIQHIVAVALPSQGTQGVTGQDRAKDDAQLVCDALGVQMTMIDMAPIVDVIGNQVRTSLIGLPANTWAEGQLVSYARTPTYYYITSLLAANGLPGVVLGTTNLSEGGYLGYFGKASDGMVDVQMISDVYKSEVYKVAELLNIPQSIINKAPTGDMFDACDDEEVFGAPYDYVELFMEHCRTDINRFSPSFDDIEKMHKWRENLYQMRKYNAHKYVGNSPAVHLDIMPCAMVSGWNNQKEIQDFQVDTQVFKGYFEPKNIAGFGHRPERAVATAQQVHPLIPYDHAFKTDLLNAMEVERFKGILESAPWIEVGENGYEGAPGSGSSRATFVSDLIATDLWSRLRSCLSSLRVFDGLEPTDFEGNRIWIPIGVSPVFRAIRYLPGGMLVPHYDTTYEVGPRRRTLKSVVIQISGHDGATRFIKDPQAGVAVCSRNTEDWTVAPTSDQVIVSLEPRPGQAIVFDHKMLHDGAVVTSGEKVIIRTDIVYERPDFFQ
jgi:NAD+ synthetase